MYLSRHQEESSEEEEDEDEQPVKPEKEENIGKVVCVESTEAKKKSQKENWFPELVVAPTAQDTVRIRVKDEYLVRSFKDGRYYTVPKKEANEFTRELAKKQEHNAAVQAALEYLDKDTLPAHWDRDVLFGLSFSCSECEVDLDSDSSDDEPREEKDHFVAQLYKYMDDRGTSLNKGPQINNKDIDLYRWGWRRRSEGSFQGLISSSSFFCLFPTLPGGAETRRLQPRDEPEPVEGDRGAPGLRLGHHERDEPRQAGVQEVPAALRGL